jgi:hypothetical protein
MEAIRTVRVRLVLDIAIDVKPIDPTGPDVGDPVKAELSAHTQTAVLQNQKLLDQQINLELLNFLESLDRDQIKEALGLDWRGPYETYPESYLQALDGEDAKVLRTAHEEGSLWQLLEDFSDSFHAQLTGASKKVVSGK